MLRDYLQRLERDERELCSAVQVERAQVAHLQRKVQLLRAVLSEALLSSVECVRLEA